MSKSKTKVLAEEALDELLQDYCEEIEAERLPSRLAGLATRLQILLGEREAASAAETADVLWRVAETRSEIRLNDPSWQNYDLRGWDTRFYHS